LPNTITNGTARLNLGDQLSDLYSIRILNG